MTFIDLFAGIGGARRGMELAGHECIGFCEWDKFAVASYVSMHLLTDEQRKYLATLPLNKRQKEILKEEYRNGEWYMKDVQEITGQNIPKADCWCFGAPCFVAGTLVTTSEGMKPIEDIQSGDMVLTHKNRFRRVVKPMKSIKTGIYTLKVQGSPKIECTANHRFYVRDVLKRKWNNEARSYNQVFSEPYWKEVKDFNGKEMILVPCNQNASNILNLTDEECWLIGRYVADGYLQDYPRNNRPSNTRRVAFCIGNSKVNDFEKHLNNIGMHISKERTATKFITTNKRLFKLCDCCGRHAENKKIPSYILNLPNEKLSIFLNGYLSGDGCFSKKENLYKATSTSKVLVYQLAQIVNKLYQVSCSIFYFQRPEQTTIEGRIVDQHDSWSIQFKKEAKKQDKWKYIDGQLWMPVKKILFESNRTEIVYNMEVEEDNSYTANNLAVHNCQDFSVAGKRKGLNGERSSLVGEIFRILREQEETDRPEWLIYENVRGMLSSNRGFDFLSILAEMASCGYDIQYELLNTADYSPPQHRERVYTVGHLRAYGPAKIFPLERANGQNSVQVGIVGHRDGYRRNTQVFDPDGITEALDTAAGGGRGHHTIVPIEVIGNTRPPRDNYGEDRDRVLGVTGTAPSLCSTDYKEPIKVGVPVTLNSKDGIGKELEIAHSLNSSDWRGLNRNQDQNGVVVQIGLRTDTNRDNPQRNRVYDSNGLSPSLNGIGKGGNLEPQVAIPITDLATEPGFNRRNVIHSVNGISRTLIGGGGEGGYHDGNQPKVAIPIGIIDTQGRTQKEVEPSNVSPTIRSETHGNLPSVVLPVITPDRAEKRQNGRRFKENGESAFTLTAQDKHGVAISIDDLYANREVRVSETECPTLRGERNGLKVGVSVEPIGGTYINQSGEFNRGILDGTARTLKADGKAQGMVFGIRAEDYWIAEGEEGKEHPGIYVRLTEDCIIYAVWYEKYQCYIAIRKLTPRECFRLQGWTDDYFEKAEFVNSDSQLYKQAGNGISVPVMEAVARKMSKHEQA